MRDAFDVVFRCSFAEEATAIVMPAPQGCVNLRRAKIS
jgi:hypothetical protein